MIRLINVTMLVDTDDVDHDDLSAGVEARLDEFYPTDDFVAVPGHVLVEVRDVRTWADGFGRWYARVPNVAFPTRDLASHAIRLELEARKGPRDIITAPRVERAPEYDTDTTTVYREKSDS